MSRRSVCTSIVTLLALATATRAAPTTMPADVATLRARVATLEAQVEALQKQLAAATGRVDPATYATITTAARTRMRADLTTLTQPQLAEVERLYQPSNDRSLRGTPAVKASLEKLIAIYPTANRAGCALRYLAQWAEGEERERLLHDAADKHGDAFYGDGCQVGPYALFQLAAD